MFDKVLTRYWKLVGAAIVLLGLLLRIPAFGSMPGGLYWDEQAMLMDARSVAATGLDVHGESALQALFPSYGDYKLPGYIWITSLLVRVLGSEPWVVRLPSLLAGLGTIIVAGLIAAELWDGKRHRLVGLATALMVAIAPWSIHFSRVGFEAHVAQVLVGVSVWLILAQPKRWGWVLASALIGVAATYTYFSVRFVWPVVWSAALLWHWTHTKSWGEWRQWVLRIGVGLVLFSSLLLPLFRSPHYQPSQQYRLSTDSILQTDYAVASNQLREIAGNTFLDRVLFHRYVLFARALLAQVAEHVSLTFLFVNGDSNLRHGWHGLFLLPMVIFFAVGWYQLASKNWRSGALLALWWLAALIPASVPAAVPHALRSLNALIPLTIVLGVGAGAVWSWSATVGAWKRWLIGLLVLGWVGVALAQFVLTYYFVYPEQLATEWQVGHAALADYIWEHRTEADQVWIDPFDQKIYLWLWPHLSPNQLQQTEKTAYQTPSLENISIRGIQWEALTAPETEGSVLVVGPEAYVTENLERFAIEPQRTTVVETRSTNYLIVLFE